MNMPIRRALKVPPLENGDQLTADEFERRYFTMPEVKKAELIEGVVFMPSPVSYDYHGEQNTALIWLLKHYSVFTPGTIASDNTTVKLDKNNELQPDVFLAIRPECEGSVTIDKKGYVHGTPELVAEVSGSSASIDLGPKRDVYERHKAREYFIWRVYDAAIDWFTLTRGKFTPLAPDSSDGLLKSRIFPGLWLDATALLEGNNPAVLVALMKGIESPEHKAFVAKLAAKKSKK